MLTKQANELIDQVNELYNIRNQIELVNTEIMELIGLSNKTSLSFFSDDGGNFHLSNYKDNRLGEYECTPENIEKALSCGTYNEFKSFMNTIEINKRDVPRGIYINIKDIAKLSETTPEIYVNSFEGK